MRLSYELQALLILIGVLIFLFVAVVVVAYQRVQGGEREVGDQATPCAIEKGAVLPLLPTPGDQFFPLTDRAMHSVSYGYGGRIAEVRQRCYSNGYGVLLIIDNWHFAEMPPWDRNYDIPIRAWVDALVEHGHNPRKRNRRLSFRAVYNHDTSPTGVEYWVKVHHEGYDPEDDEIFAQPTRAQHFDSKDALEGLW